MKNPNQVKYLHLDFVLIIFFYFVVIIWAAIHAFRSTPKFGMKTSTLPSGFGYSSVSFVQWTFYKMNIKNHDYVISGQHKI